MRCLKCGRDMGDEISCLYCNNQDIIELPILKDEKIIEDNLNKLEVFDSDASVNYRKKILSRGLIIILIVLCFCGLFILVKNSFIGREIPYGFNINEVEMSLKSFRESADVQVFAGVLDNISDDDKENVYELVNTRFKGWILELRDVDFNSSDEFNEEINDYVFLLNKLKIIDIISDEDYDLISKELNVLREDGTLYYKAISMYNNKSYNEAYNMLVKIDENNIYYEDGCSLLNEIEDDVIDLIVSDVSKLEEEIEYFDETKRNERYLQIILVFETYSEVYNMIDLKNNSRYVELFERYNSYVR